MLAEECCFSEQESMLPECLRLSARRLSYSKFKLSSLQREFENVLKSDGRNPWFRTAVLSAIALARQQEANDWLLGHVEEEDSDASAAHEALCRSAPSAATIERLIQLGTPCVGN